MFPRIVISVFKPDFVGNVKIDQRISFSNRSPIEKQFTDLKYRRDTKPDPEFPVKIDLRF
jgi:hypothetical protein